MADQGGRGEAGEMLTMADKGGRGGLDPSIFGWHNVWTAPNELQQFVLDSPPTVGLSISDSIQLLSVTRNNVFKDID